MQHTDVQNRLLAMDATSDSYATDFVGELLTSAQHRLVSDLHLQPTSEGLQVQWRVDGVLQTIGLFPLGTVTSIVARLKVLAELLTYRTEIPQEGRVREGGNSANSQSTIEMRVSTFPTLYGERAVVRFFASQSEYQYLDQLGLPASMAADLGRFLEETTGAILIAGPAGSGKTTTAYACLREVVRKTEGGRSIVSLEDPIEVPVDGVAQSQINSAAGFELASGLKSLLRQDPEVILVGEIRDHETANVAMQASLTGQLVLTTFHAGSAAEAVRRLVDMDVEPYVLRSGILAVLGQRLVRCLCKCASPIESSDELLGLKVERALCPVGCEECQHTGYRGRRVLAELMKMSAAEIGQAILQRHEVQQIQTLAQSACMVSLHDRALNAINEGWTSPAEVRRVLGFRFESGEEPR